MTIRSSDFVGMAARPIANVFPLILENYVLPIKEKVMHPCNGLLPTEGSSYGQGLASVPGKIPHAWVGLGLEGMYVAMEHHIHHIN
jgi:hypothetical protein